jgi:uncharacterized membrane protein YqjE
MKLSNLSLLALLFLTPLVCTAGEPSKGTVIMISGVSSWLVLSSGFILWKEVRKSRGSKHDEK